MRILLIEDDRKLADILRRAFAEEGYASDICHDGDEGLYYALNTEPDLIVADIMLPGKDGLTVLREIREKGIGTPLILLTARGSVDDRVKGLDLGADDYVPKPVAISELMARIRAQLRGARHAVNKIKTGAIEMNLLQRSVTASGTPISLKPKEFAILRYLMQNPNVVLTRTRIAEHVWGFNFEAVSNIIDVHISHIRAKIRSTGAPDPIETMRGAGYSFTGDHDAP